MASPPLRSSCASVSLSHPGLTMFSRSVSGNSVDSAPTNASRPAFTSAPAELSGSGVEKSPLVGVIDPRPSRAVSA